MMISIIAYLVRIIVNTPFYPHWLDFKKKRIGNKKMYKYFTGRVLETGCGNAEKKSAILKSRKKVKEYIATDYSSWDEEFATQRKKMGFMGSITQVLYGKGKDNSKIDVVCDAMNLPFKNSSFDTYCCFEVLEHIEEPETLMREAHRVLKKGGYAVFTMPFLYRDHGGLEMDFQRLTRGGFNHLAKKIGFEVVKLEASAYLGTTVAILINQYVIRKILEKGWIVKIILFPLSPFIFFTTNVAGLLIDALDQDIRFSPAYHVVFKKA